MDFCRNFTYRNCSLRLCCLLLLLGLIAISLIPASIHAVQPPATAGNSQTQEQDDKQQEKDTDTFDGEFAYAVLKQICDLGPRISGTEGMLKQQELLKAHIQANGGTVHEHKFNAASPLDGKIVEMKNLFGRWHPDRKKRVLICCHYDTRPFADRDKDNPQGVFLGANDGASGVGLLSELTRHLPGLDGKYGIDICFFDGEEFVYVARRDPMFIGSTAFANAYARNEWDVKYNFAILVDMIGDSNLQIYMEENSLKMAPRLTKSVWAVAQDMGVTEFIGKKKHVIRDDHLPLNTIARIDTCDIIDFDYPDETSENAYWHTTKDIPENCSAESIGKVGSVVLEYLKRLQEL